MSLLKIARMGQPVLRRPAREVADPTAPEVAELAADMIETMLDAPGTGLAAPQVYADLRMLVYRLSPERNAGEGLAPRVLVNPQLTVLDESLEEGIEGCLSIPELVGLVPRYRRVGFRAQGLDGRPIEGEAAGFHARVLQHEMDHLDGILYLDRMPDLSSLAFLSELGRPSREEAEREEA